MLSDQTSLRTHKDILDDGTALTILEVDNLDNELTLLIDKYLVSICEGVYSDSALIDVKERVKELFRDKSSEEDEYSTWEMGAVAEFFIHLYLNTENLKQECLFFNLEERSIKKGFDGYYSNQSEQWIVESKSGSIQTAGVSHKSKINEAVADLKKKFSGDVKNNPWSNAYNHASHIDVSAAKEIRKYIKGLSKDFTSKVSHDINDFNIIPCGTVYYEENVFHGVDNIKELISSNHRKTGKQMHIVCVSQRSVGVFKEYIGI